MANVFDYLDWRGDLTLDLVPLCDVDAVVLSRLSYLPLDGLVPPGGGAGRRAYAAAPHFEAAAAPAGGRAVHPCPCGKPALL